jgi:hypothetical protein
MCDKASEGLLPIDGVKRIDYYETWARHGKQPDDGRIRDVVDPL